MAGQIRKTDRSGTARHVAEKADYKPAPAFFTVGDFGEGLQITSVRTADGTMEFLPKAAFELTLWNVAADSEDVTLRPADCDSPGVFDSATGTITWEIAGALEVKLTVADEGFGDIVLRAKATLVQGGPYSDMGIGHLETAVRPRTTDLSDAGTRLLIPEWGGSNAATPHLIETPLVYKAFGGLATDEGGPDGILCPVAIVGLYDVLDDSRTGFVFASLGMKQRSHIAGGGEGTQFAYLGLRSYPPARRTVTPDSLSADYVIEAAPGVILALKGGSWDAAAWYRDRCFPLLAAAPWGPDDPATFAWFPGTPSGAFLTSLARDGTILSSLYAEPVEPNAPDPEFYLGSLHPKLVLDFDDVRIDVDRLVDHFGEGPIAQLYGWYRQGDDRPGFPPENADVNPSLGAAVALMDDAGAHVIPYIFPTVVNSSKYASLFPNEIVLLPDGTKFIQPVAATEGQIIYVVSPLHDSANLTAMADAWIAPYLSAVPAGDVGGCYWDTLCNWGTFPDYQPTLDDSKKGWGAEGWDLAKNSLIEAGEAILDLGGVRRRYHVAEWQNPYMPAAEIQGDVNYYGVSFQRQWIPFYRNAFSDAFRAITFYSADVGAIAASHGGIGDLWAFLAGLGFHRGYLQVTYAQQNPEAHGRYLFSIPKEDDPDFATRKWELAIWDAQKDQHVTSRSWLDAYRLNGRRLRTPRNTAERAIETQGYAFDVVFDHVNEYGRTLYAPTPTQDYGPIVSVWIRYSGRTASILILATNFRRLEAVPLEIELDVDAYPWLRGKGEVIELDFPSGSQKAKTPFYDSVVSIVAKLAPLETVAYEIPDLAPLPVELATYGGPA